LDQNSGNRTPFQTAQYQSFSTGVDNFLFNDVMLALDGDDAALKSITVGLYADSSTSPGTLVQSLGTIADTVVPSGGFSAVDFSFSAITLLSNTRYWIGLSSANQSNVLWGLEDPTIHPGDIGVSGEFISDSGIVSLSNSPQTLAAFKMRVSGTTVEPIAATPEPAGVALMLFGLLAVAVGVQARRRTKPAAN
jgi:hypothetical protein